MKFRIILFIFLLSSHNSFSEPTGQVRFWDVEDGFDERFLHKISVTHDDNVIAVQGHVNHINVLNGYERKPLDTPGYWQTTLESPDGTLWAGYGDYLTNRVHGLQRRVNGEWQRYRIPKLASQKIPTVMHPLPFIPLSASHSLFLSTSSLHLFNADLDLSRLVLHATETKLAAFHHIVADSTTTFWITGAKGLQRFAKSKDGSERVIPKNELLFDPASGYNRLRRVTIQSNNDIYGLVDSLFNPGEILFIRYQNGTWECLERLQPERYIDPVVMPTQQGYIYEAAGTLYHKIEDQTIPLSQSWHLQSPYTDYKQHEDNSLFIGTSTGLSRWSPSLWRKPNYFYANPEPVLDAFLDAEERVWFRMSNQLALVDGEEWTSFPFRVHSCYADKRGNVWAIQDDALLRYNQTGWVRYPMTDELRLESELIERPFPKTNLIAQLPDGKIAITKSSNSVALFDPQTERFHTSITLPIPEDQWIGRIYDSPEGIWIETSFHLFRYDGTEVQVLFRKSNQRDTANWLIDYFVTAGNEIWITEFERVSRFVDDTLSSFKEMDGHTIDGAGEIQQLRNGHIWIGGWQGATQRFDGQRWSTVSGPKFYGCKDILESRDGTIYVASGNHIYHFRNQSWISHGREEGLPDLWVRKILQDRHNRIWALSSLFDKQNTQNEVRLYNPQVDIDPPETNIDESVKDNEQYIAGSAIQIPIQGMDKWKYTEQDRLYYSYRINDEPWSPFQSNRVITRTLPAGRYAFEVKAMDRNWNEDPTPAFVQFQVVSPWYQDPQFLVVVCFLLIVILLLTALHFRHHINLGTMVKRRTWELSSANKKLKENQMQLRSLANELIVTEDRERQKLASDLHDRIGQSLAMCQIQLDAMRDKTNQKEMKDFLDGISKEVEQTIDDARTLSFEISPPVLYKVGLEFALRELLRQLQEKYSLNVKLQYKSIDNVLEDDLKSFLFRAVRELLFNVIKHAHTKDASVIIQQHDSDVQVVVEDQGRGIKKLPTKPSGFGLMSIEERVKFLRGTFTITTSSHSGTRIEFSVPYHN